MTEPVVIGMQAESTSILLEQLNNVLSSVEHASDAI